MEPVVEQIEQSEPGPVGVRRRYTRGFAWTLIGSVASQGAAYLTTMFCARLLGREGFGRLSIIQGTVLALANVVPLGAGITATKYVAELRGKDRARAVAILRLCSRSSGAVSALAAAGLLLAAPLIAGRVLGDSGLTAPLRWAAPYVVFFALNTVQLGALLGLEAFRPLARAQAVQAVLYAGLVLGGTALGGLAGAAGGLSISAAAIWLLYFFVTRRELARAGFPIAAGSWLAEVGVLVHLALPSALSGTFGNVAIWGAQAVLVRQPGGFAELGLFGAANTFRSLVSFLPQLLNRVASPLLCNLAGEAAGNRFGKLLWSNTVVVGGLSLLTSVGIWYLGPVLLPLFGKEFHGGQTVIALLLVATVLETICVGLAQTLISHNRMWWQVGFMVPWGLCLVGAASCWTPLLGAVGLARSYLAAWSFGIAAFLWMNQRLLHGPAAPTPPVALSGQ